jgi:hypothetical protein
LFITKENISAAYNPQVNICRGTKKSDS